MEIPDIVLTYVNEVQEIYWEDDLILGLSNKVELQKRDALSKKRKMLLVTGLSGSGKDSIIDLLLKNDERITRIKTSTTRPRRPEELEENDPHIRLTIEEFQAALAAGEVMEYVEYAGNYMCTSRKVIEESFNGDKIPVLRVDPQGARFYYNKWLEGDRLFKDITLIYAFIITPSIEVLRERLLKRSGDKNFVEKRIEQSMKDVTYLGDAEYILINESGKLEQLVEQVSKLIYQ